MNRTIILLTLLLSSITMHAAKMKLLDSKYYIYRFVLRDKAATSYSLDAPQQFLSPKSLERRRRQGISVDSTDLPVCKAYIHQFEVRGVKILGTSRWQNTILVQSADSALLNLLGRMDIVRQAICVFVTPDSLDMPGDVRWNVHEDFNRWDSVKNDPYGMARNQIEMIGGTRLHEAGFTGQGITIAIVDGGFQNYDRIPAFRNTHIKGTCNFVPAHIDSMLPDDTRPVPFHRPRHQSTLRLSRQCARSPHRHRP